ncbi:MAG: acyltransferase [Alphaproteobacteria bacterium]|nr:acyltransferase [Alphaproteobacteria bacterium]
MNRTNADAFRLDINALRALSVVAVVGYHFQIPGFAGGFIGVDVFLVITGYLMTGKVLRDLLRGRFSFFDFSIARMRRIVPALAVMIAASVVAGWFVTVPGLYQKHTQQAVSALTFVSNFIFDKENGYFAMAAQTKPLLHTWSLSIEWQFYIWMPLAVALVWRRGGWLKNSGRFLGQNRRQHRSSDQGCADPVPGAASSDKSRLNTAIAALLVVAGASLLWCLWQSHLGATASSFFSLRARAWEPLAGGLIAAFEITRRSDCRASPMSWLELPVIAVLSWVLIAGSIAWPLPESQWPGALTILPVLGAALIIRARCGTGATRLLGNFLVQRIGDWSYSIYLWHWPIFVFSLIWLSFHGYSLDARHKLVMVLLSLALSVASYRYVEQPFRERRDFWTARRLLGSYSAVVAALLVFLVAVNVTRGFPSRLPDYMRAAEEARKLDTPRDECFRDGRSMKQAPETYCGFGSAEGTGRPSVLLWGDSFANQYLEPVSAAALAHGLHGWIATQSACRPLADDASRSSADQAHCREFNRSTLELAMKPDGPGILVIGGNWGNASEITDLAERLLSSGKAVVLILPLLALDFDVPQRWMEMQAKAGHSVAEWKVDADPVVTRSAMRAEIGQRLGRYRDNPRLIFVDPQSVVCEPHECYLVRNAQANFRDTAHISNVNALQYEGLFDAAFATAMGSRTEKQKELH